MKQANPEEKFSTLRRRAGQVLMPAVVVILALVLWQAWNHPAMRQWQQEASPLAFFTLLALVPAVGVPVTPLYILAGATFGAWLGLWGTLLALAANLALCYRVSHGSLRPWLENRLRRSRFDLPDYRDRNMSAAVRFTLLVRLAPGLPSFAKNYALGLAGVPFAVYFALSFAINGVYAGLLVVLGEGLLGHDLTKSAVPLVFLGVAAAVGFVWFRKRRKRQAR